MEDGGVHVDRGGQGGWWLHFEEGEPGDDGHEATQLLLGVEGCVSTPPCEAPDNTMFSLGIPSSTNSSITPSMVAKASSRSSLLSPATGESTDAPGISQKLNQDVTKGLVPRIIVGGKIAVLFVGPKLKDISPRSCSVRVQALDPRTTHTQEPWWRALPSRGER